MNDVEWISIEDVLPDEDSNDRYWVALKSGKVDIATYSEWGWSDAIGYFDIADVVLWCKLIYPILEKK